LWTTTVTQPGQFRRGYFEIHEGESGLTIDEDESDSFFPSVYYHQNGKVSVPPGAVVAVPLSGNEGYRVSNDLLGFPPYSVFGRLDPRVSPTVRDRPSIASLPPMRLADAQRLVLRSGVLVWERWDSTRPLREDEEWLAALKARCGREDGATPLEVNASAGRLYIRLGTCDLEMEHPADSAGRPLWMAIVAARDWDFVERRDGGWRVHRDLDPQWVPVLALIVPIKGVLMVYATGALAALSTSVTIWLGSLWFAPLAIACWGVSGMIALLAASWHALRKRQRLRRGGLWLLIVLMGGGLATRLLMDSRATPAATARPERNLAQIGREPTCVLAGYSTADGAAVRPGSRATWQLLAETCSACGGGAFKIARRGGTIAGLADLLCSPRLAHALRGKSVVFLGGSNDDYSYWTNLESPVAHMLMHHPTVVRIFYYYSNPTSARLLELMRDSAAASLALMERQEGDLARAAQCVARQGSSFRFFHDFVLFDLEEGRSSDRQSMVERRREAMQNANGELIDLYQLFREEAGISWFNDFIHLSSIGHRRVAERICRFVEESKESDLLAPPAPAALGDDDDLAVKAFARALGR
jgi:hypothetical protein